jgi:hypothetical protein
VDSYQMCQQVIGNGERPPITRPPPEQPMATNDLKRPLHDIADGQTGFSLGFQRRFGLLNGWTFAKRNASN